MISVGARVGARVGASVGARVGARESRGTQLYLPNDLSHSPCQR